MSRRLRRVVEQLESRTLFAAGTTTFSFAAADHAAVETNYFTGHGGDLGSATIVGSDVTAVRNRQGFRLPTGTFMVSPDAPALGVTTERASGLLPDGEL